MDKVTLVEIHDPVQIQLVKSALTHAGFDYDVLHENTLLIDSVHFGGINPAIVRVWPRERAAARRELVLAGLLVDHDPGKDSFPVYSRIAEWTGRVPGLRVLPAEVRFLVLAAGVLVGGFLWVVSMLG